MERDTLEFRGEIRYEAGEPPSFRFVVDSTRMPIGFARVDPPPPSVILITSRDANEVVARHEGNSQRAVTRNSHSKSSEPVLTFAPQLGWKGEGEARRNKRTHVHIRSSTRSFLSYLSPFCLVRRERTRDITG